MHAPPTCAAFLAAAALLAGCASNQPRLGMHVAPALHAGQGEQSATAYYALGRLHHGAQRHDEAQQAYARAIELDRRQPEAHNALGILYAGRRDFAAAVVLLREAVRLDPTNSQLHSNLGYALYLNEEHGHAALALEEALRLNPGNIYARNNLAVVNKALGRPAPSPTERTAPDGHSGAAATQSRTAEPAGESEPRITLRQVGTGMYEVQMPPAAGVPVHPQSAAAPAPGSQGSAPARLEISNGNGVARMARSAAAILGGGRLRVVRLTNQTRFNVQFTRVEYRAEHQAAARALAAQLGIGETGLRPAAPGAQPDIRLVLGHDLRDLDALRARYRQRAMHAAADGNSSGGHSI